MFVIGKPLVADRVFRKCISNKTSIVVPFYAYPVYTNVSWQSDSGETTHVNTTSQNARVHVTIRGATAVIPGQAVVLNAPDGLPASLILTLTNSEGSSSLKLTQCAGTKMIM